MSISVDTPQVLLVFAIEHKTTKRITNTPEQERSISFHPEGRQLVYASERNNSWNLYTTKIAREEEKSFYLSGGQDLSLNQYKNLFH